MRGPRALGRKYRGSKPRFHNISFGAPGFTVIKYAGLPASKSLGFRSRFKSKNFGAPGLHRPPPPFRTLTSISQALGKIPSFLVLAPLGLINVWSGLRGGGGAYRGGTYDTSPCFVLTFKDVRANCFCALLLRTQIHVAQ